MVPEPGARDTTTHSQQRSITLRNQPGDSVIFGEVDDADRALEPRLLERIRRGARRLQVEKEVARSMVERGFVAAGQRRPDSFSLGGNDVLTPAAGHPYRLSK